MGCITSRRGKKLAPAANPPPASWIYKARTSAQQMLAYDTAYGDIKEITITTDSQFQQGQALGVWGTGVIFLVGGIEDGLTALKVDMSMNLASRVLSPPYPLAYGYLQRHANKLYLVGALTTNNTGHMEVSAPPMTFNPSLSKWEPLPALPESVALCGSFFLNDNLYLLGGFLDFPSLPQPFRKVLRYSLKDDTWATLPLPSPIETALPACIPINGQSALIIGGFDPTDQLGESNSVYRFQLTGFETLDSLPDLGQRRFTDCPYLFNGRVYVISEDETIFIYSLNTVEWTAVDLVEKLRKSLTGDEGIRQSSRNPTGYVYHYLDSECAWLELCLADQSSRKVEPSIFHSYIKHPGLLMMDSGSIMIAGGLKRTRDVREAVDSVWAFDPGNKQTWDEMKLPKRQYGLRLVVVAGNVYAVAGITESEAGGRCQCYDTSKKEWKPLPTMPYASKFPGVSYFQDRIYVLCGTAEVMEGVTALNLIQVYTPSTSTWDLRTTEYPQGVRSLCVYVLDPSHLLCAGGVYTSSDPCHKAYLFDGTNFEEIDNLPVTSSSKADSNFQDPVTRCGDCLYMCAQSGALYVFNVNIWGWSLQESLISNRM